MYSAFKSLKWTYGIIKYSLPYYYHKLFFMRFTYSKGTAMWQKLEKGIITGDKISVKLFSSAINLIVKSTEKECKGPLTRLGVRH